MEADSAVPVVIVFTDDLVLCLTEGAGSLPWTGGSAAKPGKPKGKKKLSSVRQKFDVGLSSQVW